MSSAKRRIEMSKFINRHSVEEMKEIGLTYDIEVPEELVEKEEILKYLLDNGMPFYNNFNGF
jgi:hypothetical protein